MEKREDYWWRESTLGEDVDGKVGTYLRANHQEYQEIRHQIDELIQQYPAVRELFESEDAVTLTAEEHKALIRYFCLESSVEMIEREYHFYMGQSMMWVRFPPPAEQSFRHRTPSTSCLRRLSHTAQ